MTPISLPLLHPSRTRDPGHRAHPIDRDSKTLKACPGLGRQPIHRGSGPRPPAPECLIPTLGAELDLHTNHGHPPPSPQRPAPPLPQNITCNSVTKLALLSKLARPRPPAMLRMPLTLPPPKGTTHFEISLRRWPSMKKFTPACAIHSTGTSLSQHVSSTPGALEVDPYADAGGTQVAEHAH